jgi:hypothetical protein
VASNKRDLKRRALQERPRRSLEEVRSPLRASLEHAVSHSGAPQHRAAKWLGVNTSTLRRWQYGQSPIAIEAVMRAPRLWRSFLLCLISLERKAGML